jgi:hypothetical protein
MEIRIRNQRDFLRETKLPGAVFRGQTHDFGNLTPSYYRKDWEFDLDALAELASEYYLEIHDRLHKVNYGASVYEGGYERSRGPFPDLSWLASGGEDTGPLIPIRVEMPFNRIILAFKAMTDPQAAEELTDLEAHDDELNWEKFEKEAGFMKLYKEPSYKLARLQHYGIPTPALDVSFDPYVALWFATHQLIVDRKSRTGFYEKSGHEGVVYVLKPAEHEIADLRRQHIVPLGGLRGHRQEGALLLGASRTEPDLSRCIVKKLIVTAKLLKPRIWRLRQRLRARRLNQSFLFPTGSKDSFYGMLLHDKRGKYAELAKWVIEYVH